MNQGRRGHNSKGCVRFKPKAVGLMLRCSWVMLNRVFGMFGISFQKCSKPWALLCSCPIKPLFRVSVVRSIRSPRPPEHAARVTAGRAPKSKQDKQANKKTQTELRHKKASKQSSRQANKQTNKHNHSQANIQTSTPDQQQITCPRPLFGT